jgi:hypothetical protein
MTGGCLLDVTATFICHASSFIREAASFIDDAASLIHEATSFIDDGASLIHDATSLIHEATSFIRDAASFIRAARNDALCNLFRGRASNLIGRGRVRSAGVGEDLPNGRQLVTGEL